MNSLYSTIYIKTDRNQAELFDFVCQQLPNDAQKYSLTVETSTVEVTLNANPDAFDGSEYEDYPLCLEIDSNDKGASEEQYLEFITRMLVVLWDAGISTVTVSDFELDLPHGGCWNSSTP